MSKSSTATDQQLITSFLAAHHLVDFGLPVFPPASKPVSELGGSGSGLAGTLFTLDVGGEVFSLRTLWLPGIVELRQAIDILQSHRPEYLNHAIGALIERLHRDIECVCARGGLLHVGCEV